MSNFVEELWYKVTQRSGGQYTEVRGRYRGAVPETEDEEGGHHLFEVEGKEAPLRIHPDHIVYFEAVPPMPFPRQG